MKVRVAYVCALVLVLASYRPAAQSPASQPDRVDALFKDLKWRNIGPANMAGRVTDIDAVESNPAIVYVAAASGGVWKSVNAGTTWEPIFTNYGTSSIGGPTHLLAALFNTVAGIKTLHVPYKGGGPAVVDLMGGHIHFFFSNPVNVSAQIKSGRLRAIAVTGQSRIGAFPDVPTFTEEGMPAMTLTNWQGVGGPAGIPKSIIDRISAEIRKLVAKPDTKEKLNALGSEPYYNNPEQTAALIKSDIAKYGKIIKDANIKAE